MKQQSYLVWVYAILILIGGIIGFVKAGSVISISMAALFAIILFGCGYFMQQGNRTSYYVSLVSIALLLAFFGYRFFISYHFMPAGLMAILSGMTLLALILKDKGLLCKG